MESFLPEEYQFETALAEGRESVVDELFEGIEANDNVISADIEFSDHFLELWSFSDALATLVKSETENEKEVQAVIYRSFCFAVQVLDKIQLCPFDTAALGDMIQGSQNLEGAGDVIKEEVQEYISRRPGLDSLLFSFMAEIDDKYLYDHHVETAAGLLFMLSEREQAEAYLEAESESLTPDILER